MIYHLAQSCCNAFQRPQFEVTSFSKSLRLYWVKEVPFGDYLIFFIGVKVVFNILDLLCSMTEVGIMSPGDTVRVLSAPDRIGTITKRHTMSRGKKKWVVRFPDGPQSFIETNLAVIEEDESIEDLIGSGSFGEVKHLRGAITHARLTGRLADVIYSMESTNTDFYAFQFKPVLNFLQSTSNGILIADEVGLGKTIEAGLIWTELRARYDSKRLLVLCPAALREKWKSELIKRFGIKAEICDDAGALLNRLKDQSGFADSFALIASIQGMRPRKGWEDDEDIRTNSAELARFLRDGAVTDEIFDCVIIDEAHWMRNPETQTHKLGQMIRDATKHIILLSATPIQLKSDDLFHLVNIIDSENFEEKQSFDEILKANRPILKLSHLLRSGECTVELLLEYVDACLDCRLLNSSKQLADLKNYPPKQQQLDDISKRVRLANDIERVNLLGTVMNRTMKRDVKQNRVKRVPAAIQVKMNDIETAFYKAVTERVRQYCSRFDQFEGLMLTIPQRQLCSSMPAALRSWKRKIKDYRSPLSDDIFEDDDFNTDSCNQNNNSSGPLITELSQLAHEIGDYNQLKSGDSKYKLFLTKICEYWRENENEKIILFSHYRGTLEYLQERLNEDKIDTVLLMGGMSEKQSVIDNFQNDIKIRILLSSEVLTEGVDLQFSSLLINYDLPWNPMKVEQRIGRIDRIGQKKDRILIWNFFYEDTLDDRIYNRLFDRLNIFEQALGVYEVVLGQKIHHMQYHLLRHELTKEEEIAQIEQTKVAIENEKDNQEHLEKEASGLVAHGDYVLNEVNAAKEMHRYIDGANLWMYVRDFLKRKYSGSKLVQQQTSPLIIDIDLSSHAKSELRAFLDRTKEPLASALCSNVSGRAVRCVFNNKTDFSKRQHEVINHHHPLVRFAAGSTHPDDFYKVSAVVVAKEKIPGIRPGIYMILIKCWSTKGAMTIERMNYRGIGLSTKKFLGDAESEKLAVCAVNDGQDWGGAPSVVDSEVAQEGYHRLDALFDDEFDEYCKRMLLQNDDRISFLIMSLNDKLDRQIRSKQQAIQTLQSRGKTKMIGLQEAQIRKLEDKRSERVYALEKKRQISNDQRDVTLGFINVE